MPERGYDPRDFVLVAFDGFGALDASSLARKMCIARILIPLSPELASAWSMLMTDLTHEFAATRRQ
jgi:N-methylhydantoinase A